MNYIVFDLEWNQSPGGKKYSNSRLPFEIIEIGAVKMNEQREVVDVFQRLVKPQVYNWIHDSIHEVIHVDYKDLADGVAFPAGGQRISEVVRRGICFLYLGKSGCYGTTAKYEVLWNAFAASRTGHIL